MYFRWDINTTTTTTARPYLLSARVRVIGGVETLRRRGIDAGLAADVHTLAGIAVHLVGVDLVHVLRQHRPVHLAGARHQERHEGDESQTSSVLPAVLSVLLLLLLLLLLLARGLGGGITGSWEVLVFGLPVSWWLCELCHGCFP